MFPVSYIKDEIAVGFARGVTHHSFCLLGRILLREVGNVILRHRNHLGIFLSIRLFPREVSSLDTREVRLQGGLTSRSPSSSFNH